MEQKRYSPVLLTLTVIILLILAVIGVAFWLSLQAAPASQYSLARHRWETNSIVHYRMAANYSSKFAQCYYDIEVRQERIVRFISWTCLGNAETNTLTIGGIFEYFQRYATQKVCSPNGCYCEGRYVVRATYDTTLGYPQSITTFFDRAWLDDLLHGKIGVRECLRAEPVPEKIEIVKFIILP